MVAKLLLLSYHNKNKKQKKDEAQSLLPYIHVSMNNKN